MKRIYQCIVYCQLNTRVHYLAMGNAGQDQAAGTVGTDMGNANQDQAFATFAAGIDVHVGNADQDITRASLGNTMDKDGICMDHSLGKNRSGLEAVVTVAVVTVIVGGCPDCTMH